MTIGSPIGQAIGVPIGRAIGSSSGGSWSNNFSAGELASNITFTRASSGTYFNSAGVNTLTGTNEARFNHDPATLAPLGLLVEGASTNLLLYSADMTQANWIKTGTPTVVSGIAGAPDGTAAWSKITRTIVGASYVQQAIIKSASSLPSAISFYAKVGANGGFLAVRLQGLYPNRSDVVFNLNTGAVGSTTNAGTGFTGSATARSIGGGVYRFTLSSPTSDTSTGLITIFSPNTNGMNQVDGTDSAANAEALIWGVQLEQLPFASSYIPTTTATATRAADVVGVGSLSSVGFNNSAGTIIVGASQPELYASSRTAVSLSDGTINNRLTQYRQAAGGINAFRTQGGVAAALASGVSAVANTPWKSALGFSGGTLSFSANGSSVVTNTYSFAPSILNNLQIGAVVPTDGTENWYGHIQFLTYYPYRLTDGELQSKTA